MTRTVQYTLQVRQFIYIKKRFSWIFESLSSPCLQPKHGLRTKDRHWCRKTGSYLFCCLRRSLGGMLRSTMSTVRAHCRIHSFLMAAIWTRVGRSCIHPFILKGHSHEIDFLKVYIYIFKSAFSVCALFFALTVTGNFFQRLWWKNLRNGHTFRGRLSEVVWGHMRLSAAAFSAQNCCF